MMADDSTRQITDLLKDIRADLSTLRAEVSGFRQDTEKRLAALEERGSAERFKSIEQNLHDTDREVTTLRTQMKIYVGLGTALGALIGPFLLKLLGKIG